MENSNQELFITPVTIKECKPLYKFDKESGRIIESNKIKLITFNENTFEVVSTKTEDTIVGSKHFYVFPDTCLTPNSLMDSTVDYKKLGKIKGSQVRVRAIKFNWGTNNLNPTHVYSNGILLTSASIGEYLNEIAKEDCIDDMINLQTAIGLYKIDDEEDTPHRLNRASRPSKFPIGVTRTTETNINRIGNAAFDYPCRLVVSLKADGSSATFGTISKKPFIASRNINKSDSIFIQKLKGFREATLLEKIKIKLNSFLPRQYHFHVDLSIFEWYFNGEDDFVKFGYPMVQHIIDNREKLPNYDTDIIFRGELSGRSMKGSGNKNNPHRNQDNKIRVFTGEYYSDGLLTRMNYDELSDFCKFLNFEQVPTVFNGVVNSHEELMEICNNYFKSNLVEGVVVRDFNQNISYKVMNNEYDASK